MKQQETLVATVNTSDINTPVEKPRLPKNPESDVTYHRLRDGIRNKFKSLIEEERPIFHSPNAFQNGFKEFTSHIDENDQQHYNCICCRQFFKEAATLSYLNDEFKAVNILKEVFDDIFGTDYTHAIFNETNEFRVKDANRVMNAEVYTETKNQWDHFFAFTQEEAEAINNRGYIDVGFTETFFMTIKNVDIALLKTLIPYLDEALYVPKSVGLLKPLAKLLDDWKSSVIKNKVSLYHVIGILSRESKTNWLKGVKSSSAGNVLEYLISAPAYPYAGETSEEAKARQLKNLVNQINEQTDPIRYKKAIAEASEQQLLKSAEKLKELGVPRLLERKVVEVNDLPFAWIRKHEEATEESTEGLSAVEIALKARLKESNKVVKKETGEDLKSLVGLNPITKSISLKKFLELLPTFDRIRYLSSKVIAMTATKPVDDTDYSEVLYGSIDGKLIRFIYNAVSITPYMDGARGYEVESIVTIKRKDGEFHCIHIPELKEVFEEVFSKQGTVVLGDDIDPKFKDHIRPWTELSKTMSIDKIEGEGFFGAHIVTNTIFLVVNKDGVAFQYHIASAE